MISSGMLMDGIIASECIDSSGEILSVEGADIGDFEDGKANLNWEHRSDDSNGASPNDVIGKFVYVKKIFSRGDCENSRQEKYWNELNDKDDKGIPFIYGVARLFDAAGHPGAVAAAAMIRDHVANEEPLLCRFSVEGSTLKRDGNRLVHTMARRAALTVKPCNRSCNTGLLLDPNAPPGFKKEFQEAKDLLAELAENKKSERQPDYMVLSGHVNEYSVFPEDLSKAIAAGGYNSAPGTLTQGEALQREDQSLHRAHLKNQARAALRDWNQKSEPDFKKYMAGKLPDADEGFIDRFAEMVNDYRIRKSQPRPEDPDLFKPMEKKAPEPPGGDAPEPDFVNESHLTIRGKPAKTSTVGKHAKFDSNTGILHTQFGQFPMHIPSRDQDPRGREGFANALADPRPNAVHAGAMKQWRRAHELLKQRRLPDAVVMHAALFGLMSQNTPVPVQEMMYGHLVDEMNQKNVDARNPDFKWLKPAWMRRDNPLEYPRQSREHFLRNDHLLRVKAEHAVEQKRMPGDIKAFQLANGKFENAAKYHKMHDKLMELLQHHGHDAQAAAEDLMTHKQAHELWDKGQAREIEAGQQARGEFPGIPTAGFAPKVARYTLGMLGGGNIVVPDTHFIRHLFGLDRGLDTKTIDYLKSVIANPGNSQVLNEIDNYYQKNHDAMNHVRSMPELQGVDDRDLVFPAFWRHWSAIVPHEQARGMRTGGYNEYTDHQPFWDAIQKYLDAEEQNKEILKHDQDAFHTAMDTVNQHLHWAEHLGEGPAQILYWHLLAPKLLGNAETETLGPDANGEVDKIGKAEQLAVNLAIVLQELRKKADELEAAKPPTHVVFAGKKVKPGKVSMHTNGALDGQQYHIIGHDDNDLFVVPHGHLNWKPSEVSRLSKLGQGVGYYVNRWPQYLGSDKVVNASVHGHALNQSPEQAKLIHGLDMGKRSLSDHSQVDHHGGLNMQWRKGPQGVVVLKADPGVQGFGGSHKEVAFYNAARDIFGLHKYLPTAAMMQHPTTGQNVAVIEKLKGAHHPDPYDPDFNTHLAQLHSSGELDKLGLMDFVLGNTDRNEMNFMMTPEGLKLIDHEFAFNVHKPDEVFKAGRWMPAYLEHHHHQNNATPVIHPQAGRWIRNISPEQLAEGLKKSGVPAENITSALHRLSKAHEFYDLNPNGFSWTDLVD